MNAEFEQKRTNLLEIRDEIRHGRPYQLFNGVSVGPHSPYALPTTPLILIGNVISARAESVVAEHAHQAPEAVEHQTAQKIGPMNLDTFRTAAPDPEPLNLIPQFLRD